jgi:hypothetical protein
VNDRYFAVLLASFIFFIASCSSTLHKGNVYSIIGTWELVSYEAADAGSSPLGTDPFGLLIYDAAGNVSAQLSRRDRSGVQSTLTSRPGGTSASDGYIAYFGTYSVDWQQHVITHRLTGAVAASDVGRAVTRRFRVDKSRLILEVGTSPDVRILTFRRVSK